MVLSLNDKFLADYVTAQELKNISKEAESAHKTLMSRSGAGNDFLGWIDLPVNYDKDEFERIKKPQKKYRIPVIYL